MRPRMNGAPIIGWATPPDGGFVGEEVDVLRHEDLGEDQEAVLGSGVFEDLFQGGPGFGCGEEGVAAVTAEGEEIDWFAGSVLGRLAWWSGQFTLPPFAVRRMGTVGGLNSGLRARSDVHLWCET